MTLWLFNVGTQIDTSKKAVELAHQYKEGVYAIVGLHPIHTGASYHDKQELGDEGEEFTSRGEIFDKNIYRELLQDEKVVAIGECGLDYYHDETESITKQKEAFIAQIELANEFNKPLMLHIRDAYADRSNYFKRIRKGKGSGSFFHWHVRRGSGFSGFWFYDFFCWRNNFSSQKRRYGFTF